MFFTQRPSPAVIERFLHASQDAPLSYAPIGTLGNGVSNNLDEAIVTIGSG